MGAGDRKWMLAGGWYLPFDDHRWCCSPSVVISWGCGSVVVVWEIERSDEQHMHEFQHVTDYPVSGTKYKIRFDDLFVSQIKIIYSFRVLSGAVR